MENVINRERNAEPVGMRRELKLDRPLRLLSRRLLDILFSLLGLVILSPLMLGIALLVRRSTGAAAFYYGRRVGLQGKVFLIRKFRTMREQVGGNSPAVTAGDDPRITPLGRLLRTTKLNELPQLLNVLCGEMTLVGPRPEDPQIVAVWPQGVRDEILSVRPGITCLSSVLYVDEEKLLKYADVTETYLQSILPQKLRLDLLYVRNRSLLLDLDILFRTLFRLIPSMRQAGLSAEEILFGPVRQVQQYLSWFTIDTLIAFIAVGISGITWRSLVVLDVGPGRAFSAALIMTAVFSATNWLSGIQQVHWKYAGGSEAIDVFFSTAIATLMLWIGNSIYQWMPAGLVLMVGGLALVGFLFARFYRPLIAGLNSKIERLRAAALSGRERVLVVGAGEAGQLTIWLLRNRPEGKALNIIGAVDDNLDLLGSLVHKVPVIGLTQHIPQVVEQHNIGLIIFAVHNCSAAQRCRILENCWSSSARTVVVPDILTYLRGGVSPTDRRTWVPAVGSSSFDPQMPEAALELRDHIQILAELARLGNLSAVVRHLQELDRRYSTAMGEDGVAEEDRRSAGL